MALGKRERSRRVSGATVAPVVNRWAETLESFGMPPTDSHPKLVLPSSVRKGWAKVPRQPDRRRSPGGVSSEPAT
jgi:hypothetical protein